MRETPHNPFKELWRREEKDGWCTKFILLLKPSGSLVFTLMRSFCIVPGQEEKRGKKKERERKRKGKKKKREEKKSLKFKDNERLGAFLIHLQLAYTKTSVLSHGRAFALDLSEERSLCRRSRRAPRPRVGKSATSGAPAVSAGCGRQWRGATGSIADLEQHQDFFLPLCKRP